MAGSIVATTYASKGRGIVRIDCALTVTGATTLAATPIGSAFGRIVGVAYEPTAGAGATMDTTADLNLVDAVTGAVLIAEPDFGTARFERPTAAVVTAIGGAITPATTANDVNRDIFVAGKLSVSLAAVSSAAAPGVTGMFSLFVEEGR